MNNNNYRSYVRAHETEICHNGRLGCWVETESFKDRAVRLVSCALELAALGLVVFGLCALGVMA